MQPDKARRHQAILDLIRREAISSQTDLRDELAEQGFDVTQATLSRDLRELGVIKQMGPRGMYKYAMPDHSGSSPIVSCRASGNLVVLRTDVGLAPRVAYQVDALQLPEVLGTVAGEDTLLVVIDEEAPRERVVRSILKSLGQ
jgi:transcriptional regulator of arginine metabolism